MLNDFSTTPSKQPDGSRGGELVSYVMDRVNRWRNFRDGNYEKDWRKYDLIYRGEWSAELKTKQAERSRIITPATTNAVDQAVAEIVEAIFGRGVWFDVDEDGKPELEVQLAEKLQAQLIEDLHRDGIKQAVIGTVLNGAKYGTGICKRIIDQVSKAYTPPPAPAQQGPPGAPAQPAPQAPPTETMQPYVCWEPVLPQHFVIDTSAVCIKDAHGVAHETLRPKHEIERKQRSGVYFKGDVGTASGYGSADILRGPSGEVYEKAPEDGVYITEYHGFVPRWMLEKATEDTEAEADPLDVLSEDDEEAKEDETKDDLDLVEAVVTIGNASTLLKANENPIINKDRGFIAYQHYPVPNRFWGMGIPEKAWNSQSALDAEIRARMDTLALVTYPTVTADATRLPRQLDLTITPGKVIRTNGRGSEIIEPIKFGIVDAATFQHSGDLERYVQMATGAGDPSTSVNSNRSPAVAGGTTGSGSMQFGSYIKRAKLPMQTIDEQFLDPLVEKSLLAYMTVDAERYPQLFDFTVNSALSIMAREFEQMQLTNLMALLPQGSPEYQTVLKAIITNYSGPSKAQLLADIEQAAQPNPAQQQAQQLQMQTGQATLQKLQSEIAEINARANFTNSKIPAENKKLEQKDQELHIKAAKTLIDQRQVAVQERQVETAHTNHLVAHVLKAHHVNKTTEAKRKAAST